MPPICQRNSFRKQLPAYAVFSVFVLWLGALAATAYTEGMNLLSFLQAFSAQLSRPFALNWTPHSLKFLAGAMGIYIINIKRTEDGGAAPYHHSPVCLYEADDLDFAFTSLDELEIIDMEDPE